MPIYWSKICVFAVLPTPKVHKSAPHINLLTYLLTTVSFEALWRRFSGTYGKSWCQKTRVYCCFDAKVISPATIFGI